MMKKPHNLMNDEKENIIYSNGILNSKLLFNNTMSILIISQNKANLSQLKRSLCMYDI